MSLDLVLPMPPTLTNSGKGRSRHWRVLEREKAAYWLRCVAAREAGDVPPAPDTPFERATLRSVMYLGGAMDDDNAMARHKWAIDWLVGQGYLASDRRSCLRWAGIPHQVVKRDGNYRLAITLEEIA